MTKIEDYVIQKVKTMRVERGWSQRELADYLNVNHSFISDCESPKRWQKYNLNHINTLARLFECPFADFFPEKPFDD